MKALRIYLGRWIVLGKNFADLGIFSVFAIIIIAKLALSFCQLWDIIIIIEQEMNYFYLSLTSPNTCSSNLRKNAVMHVKVYYLLNIEFKIFKDIDTYKKT